MICTAATPDLCTGSATGSHVFPVMNVGDSKNCTGLIPPPQPGTPPQPPGGGGAVIPVGFVFGVVTAVGAWTGPTDRTVSIWINCIVPSNYPGGCADFGFKTSPMASTTRLFPHPTQSVRLVK